MSVTGDLPPTDVFAWVHRRDVIVRLPRGASPDPIRALGLATRVEGGYWRLNTEAAPRVVAFLGSNNRKVTDELVALAEEVEATPVVRIVRKVIRVSEDLGTPDLVATVPTAFHRREHGHQYWTVPLMDAPRVVRWADEHSLSVADDVRAAATDRWRGELDAFMRSDAASAAAPRVRGLVSELMPQQAVAVEAIQRYRRLLIADEPGLGKTLEALAALRVEGAEAERAVVVCPSGLALNWLEESVGHFDFGTFRTHVAEGETPQPVPPGTDLLIIGWSIAHAWQEAVAAWKPDALIIDEGHYAKAGAQTTRKKRTPTRTADGGFSKKVEEVVSGGSRRASAVLAMAKSVTAPKGVAPMVVDLTGTPIVNRPVEMLALLEALGVVDIFGGSGMFKERYCGPRDEYIGKGKGPKRDGIVRQYDGASNLLELNTRMRASGHYLRRTKQHLIEAGSLPAMTVDGADFYDPDAPRRPWMITPPDTAMAEYRRVEREIEQYFAQQANEIASRLRTGVGNPRVGGQLQAEQGKHLQHISALRQAAARAKVGAVVQDTERRVAAGEKVVLAAHHREVVDLYADTFGGLRIWGGQSTAEVEEAKRLFNETTVDEYPVIVLSIEAGKTGHTLCKQAILGAGKACAEMTIAEQIWVPGDEVQVEGRIWRIGQNRPVHVRNAVLAGSIDESIYRTRERKRLIALTAIDAVPPKSEREEIGALIIQLAQKGLGLQHRTAA